MLCRAQQATEQATSNTEMPHNQVVGEESQGNVHMQASGTSLSSMEVPEPIVGPIEM